MSFASSRSEVPIRLIALSNFLAAFGGGTILGKAMGVLGKEPWLHGDTLLALFFGLALSLLVVLIVPKRLAVGWSELFSFGAAELSLILIGILDRYADPAGQLVGPAAWGFFGLLCLRFALYYVARVQRSDKAAGHDQILSWSELAFYGGTILGLCVWPALPFAITIPMALGFDAVLQLSSGVLDALAGKRLPPLGEDDAGPRLALDRRAFFFLSFGIAAIELGNQGVQFAFTSVLHGLSPEGASLAPRLLAVLYLGSALAALLCATLRVAWEPASFGRPGLGRIVARANGARLGSFSAVIALSGVLLALGINGFDQQWIGSTPLVLSIFLASFFLEVTLLVVLDRMGDLAGAANRKGLVSTALGITGFAEALGLFVLMQSTSTTAGLAGFLAVLYFLGWALLVSHRPQQGPIAQATA